MNTVKRLESDVRSYCRTFPTTFVKASGWTLTDDRGRTYLDLFAGAGALNYGHNHPRLREALVKYLMADGPVHMLDMATQAKEELLDRFDRVILRPRNLSYKVQFPGPTGTNAVEAALKLARKVTGRHGVIGFTQAFHGMTLGSLSVTGNGFKRTGAGVPLNHAQSLPFAGYLGPDVDTLGVFDALLQGTSSGVDLPAAVIVETVQAEGGVNVASDAWLRRLRDVTRKHGILLIVDDIQVGCGRTGPFFSFEPAGIEPDIVCLSKSISGFGLPLALVLIAPEHDVWEPGEHNGTFRGHNAAFVTATAALEMWETPALQRDVERKGLLVAERLREIAARHPTARATERGRGLIRGLDMGVAGLASHVSRRSFELGVIAETAGAEDQVLKVLPPLTIDDADLRRGLDVIEQALADVLTQHAPAAEPALAEASA